MKRLPIHTFFYSIAYAGAAAVAVFLPFRVHWWGFAACMAELATAVIWCVWAWRRSRPKPVRPRPDYARIAQLERELLAADLTRAADFAPSAEVEHVESLIAMLDATYRKPQPPPGPGAGSPTAR